MSLSCSHVLLWVRDLHQAVVDFRALGFQVDYATDPEKAQHAHIWFRRGPVIELLTTPANARYFKWPIDLMAGRGAGERMVRWGEGGEGFCDVAVVTNDDPKAVTARLKRCGITLGRFVPWRRTRPDGQRTRFRFAYPRHGRLPFLVTPYDPPQHPATVCHDNGATALRRVRLGARVEDRVLLNNLVSDDPVFSVESAERTSVLWIELEGLSHALDGTLTHGASIRPAAVSAGAMG
ncbi:hypothetical protein A6D6_00538 [Alcanivorax xiamenensis]|uniref:Glyoxalase-like domain-containing protein n=1 Tax=Alcanivorax xiamenensis TaxID=1177156 RepID=A0ABQ6YDZ0_9GAMM|nr:MULTISPECIES: VOC family protein [Alcanivorax]KAF0808148.1 hypothetical protein A6D6_00538 [Alcanivorax xiamenensis]